MIQASIEKNSASEKTFREEYSSVSNLESIDVFFEAEEQLLKHLSRLEKTEAQQVLRGMIDAINEEAQEKRLKGIRYYFITLTGIVARYIHKHQLSPVNTFSFYEASIRLIDQKLTVDDAYDLASELVELYIYMITDRKEPNLTHHTVNKVIQFIDSKVEAPMTVEGLSKQFDVSTSHLSRIFREHTGITLVEYINVRKVEEAQYYLRFSDKKISDISDFFHFCNQSYFTRIFKKYTGETPRRFRANLSVGYFQYVLP